MPMELVFVIGMAVLLILCIKVKANAFISLLATALVMGMLSGMSGADTVSAITSGFSGTVKSIGIVIIFGIMLPFWLSASLPVCCPPTSSCLPRPALWLQRAFWASTLAVPSSTAHSAQCS